MTTHPHRKTSLILPYLILFSVIFVIWAVIFIARSSILAIDGQRYFVLFDDAMISMRYAWNLSHGLGPVWNAGERVEGYTNFLMMLIMALATGLFSKSVAALSIQILGILTVLATAFVTMKIGQLLLRDESQSRRQLLSLLFFISIVCYYPLSFWSLMGMETGLATLWLALAVYAAFKSAAHHPHLFTTAIYLGLAFLTRNETALYAGLIWAYVLASALLQRKPNQLRNLPWQGWRITPQPWKYIIGATALYSLFIIGLLAFRYAYYGEWLPNTYYLKVSGISALQRLQQGYDFVQPFFLESALLLFGSIVGLMVDSRRPKWLLAGLVAIALFYQIYIGGDAWRLWRMLVPVMPYLVILFIQGSSITLETALNHTWFQKGPPIAAGRQLLYRNSIILALGLAGCLLINLPFLAYSSHQVRPFQSDSNEKNVNTAIALQELTGPEATIGVVMAGTIPYYTDRVAYDFLGKSDAYIAQLPADTSGSVSFYGLQSVPGHNKYDLEYSIKGLLPTYVQSLSWGSQDLRAWAEDIYVQVEYQGVQLFLLANSPAVYWDKIEP